MIVVRNCFIAKPGQASKLAAKFKDAATSMEGLTFRVMTDVTGDFNRVVMEYEAASLIEFEERMRDYRANNAFREKMAGYTEMYLSGYREILDIV